MSMFYDITVTIDGDDVSALVKAAATVDYGRPTVMSDWQAPTARLEMFTEAGYPQYAGTWPDIAAWEGAPVLIHVTWDGTTQWRRFTGKVQAVEWSKYAWTISCAGNTVDLPTRLVGDTFPDTIPVGIPVPMEPDVPTGGWPTDRVTRFADEASVTVNIVGTAGRFLNPIVENTPGQPLLDALLDIASDCDGLVRETRLGDIDYVARVHTRPARYTLPAAVVHADSIDLVRERGWHRNSIYAYYGEVDPDTGSQPRVYDLDSASVSAVGERAGDPITTNLYYQVGAQGKAAQYLLDHASTWHAPDVTLLMSQATGAQADAILALDEGDPVRVTPLPDGAPVTTYDADVVGTTEVLHQTDYRIMLHLAPGQAAGDEDDGNWVPDGAITGGDETGTDVVDGRVYRWHRFDQDGTLTVDQAVAGTALVAGGGGGGGYHDGGGALGDGGGGGAGALYLNDHHLFTVGTFPVTIGAGGAGGATGTVNGATGEDTALGDLVAYGGGGGGSQSSTNGNGADGGSGGGRDIANGTTGGTALGGSYDAGATSTTIGFLVSDGAGLAQGSTALGAYGGGAGGRGLGVDSSIDTTTRTYAKGGVPGSSYTAQPANTGNGGNSGNGDYPPDAGQDGGSGVVIIRYAITPGGGTAAAYIYNEDIPYNTGITYEEA